MPGGRHLGPAVAARLYAFCETTKNSRGPAGRQARGASVFQAAAELAQTRLTVLSEVTEYVDWLISTTCGRAPPCPRPGTLG